MKNFLRKVVLWRISIVSSLVAVIAVVVVSTLSLNAATYVPLTGQVNVGDTSADVTSLQMFLAANPSIYPEGLVTGYYGALTKSAIVRFQNLYGIDPVGRVGPLTLAKINLLITSGSWNSITDVSGPRFSSVARVATANTLAFSWSTDELATAKVFYHTSPITMNEGDINSVGFGSTNGLIATNDGIARISQQILITGLQPNTLYYYVIVSTDLKGNVSVWNPNTTIRTN